MTRQDFDTTLKPGDACFCKHTLAKEAAFGTVIERFEHSEGVSYHIQPADQDWARAQEFSWSEMWDDGDEPYLMLACSWWEGDRVVRWQPERGTGTDQDPFQAEQLPADGPQPADPAPALPPNPKKLYGAQKPDLSLIPPVAQLHQAMAFENGAAKYGAYNWRDLPVEAMTYIAAAKRHLDLFLDGQDYSSDAKVHNLGHVMACCAILLDSQELGCLLDNRPKPGASEAVQNRLKAQKAAAQAAKMGG
jgi:Domain of unknown function (DUF5664)